LESLSLLFSSDGLALRFISALESLAPGISAKKGYDPRDEQIGLVSWLFIIIAYLAAFWGILNPSGDPLWMVYFGELIAGTALAAFVGMKAQPQRLSKEFYAICVGVIASAGIILIQYVAMNAGVILMSTTDHIQLTLLAPVAETLFFTLGIYATMRRIAPQVNWFFANVTSSFAFAIFHYFAYGLDPVAFIVLFAGNSILNAAYEHTKNTASVMVAHLMINMTPFWGQIPAFLQQNLIVLLVPVFLVVLYLVLGGLRR